jgi:hypothetical protein
MEQTMIPTCKAILRGNPLEWRGDIRKHIRADRAVTVYVTLVDELPVETEGAAKKQGAAMAAAPARLAETSGLADISDAATWDREARQERELPGRDA